MDAGVWRDRKVTDRTLVSDMLDRYARDILPQKKSRQAAESVIHILKKSNLVKYALSQLTPDLVVEYRDKRLHTISTKTGRITSSQTVIHEIALLSRVINHAIKEWTFPLPYGNPCLQIKMPAQSRSRDRRLDNDEEIRLLAACSDSRNVWIGSVVIFAIETAMRAGEMLETWKYLEGADGKKVKTKVSAGLQWKNIDLEKRTAHLPETKNGEACTVPLSTHAVSILKGLPRNLDGRVFGATYEGIHHAFSRACKRASIQDLHFHDLRHEATSRFFEKGFNPMEVNAITGYKTLQMLKRYNHLRAEDLAKRLH